MLITAFLIACSSSGADVTITDLDDPSGHLSESWSADTAFWFWSEGDTELWEISADTQELRYLGEVRFDPLLLSTGTSSCEDLQDLLDVGSALVNEVSDGAPLADHCDAVGTYFTDLAALDEGEGEESLSLGVYIDDLVGGTPGTGGWSEPDVIGSMVWRDGQVDNPGAGWSQGDCTYSAVESTAEVQTWSFPEVSLNIEEADSNVVGTLDAELLGDDGGSGSLTAEFEAELCQYSGGAYVFPSY